MTLSIYTHATDGMQDAATDALEDAFSERTVDALLTKSPGSASGAPLFPAICRTFLSGGTRIRTGETMIFSHVPRPLGMQQNCLGKRITVYRVSLDIAWCRRYCCPTIARPRHEHRELFLWRGSAGRLLSERSKGATLSSHGRGERTLLRAPVGEII